MSRKKKPLPFIEQLEITDAGAEGKAVGRSGERVVFVPYAAPGDVVDVQVVKKKKSYFEARIKNYIKKSSLRIEPRCSHFGLCGGCRWQHLDYGQQLEFKQKQVRDALDRIARVAYPSIKPIIASEQEYHYRNKLEFTFSNRRWLDSEDLKRADQLPHTNGLGFHLPGMFDKILDIDRCYLQQDPSNEIRLAARAYALENGLTFYDVRKWEGLLRNLIIRNTRNGDLMVIAVFRHPETEKIRGLLGHLKEKFPEITSLLYVVNEKKNDTITDLEFEVFAGKAYITESMPSPVGGRADLQFRIGPKSFFQTNTLQARRLYQAAHDFAGLKGDELVYDLYSGTGTIACYIAGSVREVIGVEYVEESVADARINCELNGIENCSFHAGDLATLLNGDFVAAHGKPDVIITDPPRSGMHPAVVRQILSAEPERIVYVSCNPATQARDISLLDEKYELTGVQPVDMFPQTHHVENIALLELRQQ